jgi:hypothetical protein
MSGKFQKFLPLGSRGCGSEFDLFRPRRSVVYMLESRSQGVSFKIEKILTNGEGVRGSWS